MPERYDLKLQINGAINAAFRIFALSGFVAKDHLMRSLDKLLSKRCVRGINEGERVAFTTYCHTKEAGSLYTNTDTK